MKSNKISRKRDNSRFVIETPLGFPNMGMAYCPGKQFNTANGIVYRNSMEDLLSIVNWRASMIVALLTHTELKTIGGSDLPKSVPAFGMAWLHIPIFKQGCFENRFYSDSLEKYIKKIIELLAQDRKILVVCDNGLERTSVFVGRLLIETGMQPERALKIIGDKKTKNLSKDQIEYLFHKMWRY